MLYNNGNESNVLIAGKPEREGWEDNDEFGME
jgi:hypothetical protein